MSETVERNNKFYEQPNGEMLTENEQLKEWLVIANKHIDELQKERDMYKGSFETMSENYFKLENIIKEVRELLQSKKHCERLFGGVEGKTFTEKEEEIERLNKELQDTKEHLGEYLHEQEEENNRLNNIIKDARLYIYNHREPVDEKNQKIIYLLTDDFDEEDILEILDKVDKE